MEFSRANSIVPAPDLGELISGLADKKKEEAEPEQEESKGGNNVHIDAIAAILNAEANRNQ